MPVTLPASFKSEIERPHGSNPLHWFVELQLTRPYRTGLTVVPSTIFRVTNRHVETAWPAGSPNSETWYPFNFTFTPIEQNQEGDLPQIDLSIDNVSRTLMRYLHNGDGMEGNYAKLILVPANGLDIAYPNHEFQQWDLQVAGAMASDEAVTFRLERANFFTRQSPQDRYVASRCRWEFGGPECGYIVNQVAAYTTCPKTMDGCIARGLDHASRGLPVLHPRRFGGFPGIPKQR
jgi:phage-related protein